nr:MAG TPA: tail fiber assembly protein [Caudoviricetes sp.]
MHYYSKSTGGFYDSTIHTTWPEDAVWITDEQHAALLAGQSNGQVIMPGKDGKPVLASKAPSHLHQWNGKEWVLDKAAASQLLAEAIDKGTDAINNLVDEAYRHVTRFQPEYEVREQQARDYKAGGCKGEAPLQVAAFAKPAGKTACEATDIIIAQADNLRMVMGKLGALRMRKFELKGLKTAAEVDKRTAEILAEIKPIADKLGEVGK